MLKGSGFWSISRNRSPFWNLQKSASGRLRRAAAGRIEGTALRESMEMLSEEKAHVSSRDVGNLKMNVAGNETIEYENFIQDVKDMIFSGIQKSYDFSHREMTLAYWKIGQSIAEEREKFGEKSLHKKTFLKRLDKELGQQFGDNFSVKNLHECAQFYRSFPEIEIVNACVHHLTWAHFRCLMRVEEERARLWYLMKSMQEHWSAVALNKNIESQIFDVLEPPPDKAAVVCALMQAAQGERQSTPGLFKSPALGQFLGFRNEGSRGEKDLRSAMVSGIRDALLETGRDFAFVGKEVPIETENGVEVMDLVFYQIRIKSYVLLNLKMGKIAPEDRRKIERCVRQYDQLKRARTESPTLGILLSSESGEEMAGFSICHDNSRLWISRYRTFLPTKERLEMEIERQKSIFYERHPS